MPFTFYFDYAEFDEGGEAIAASNGYSYEHPYLGDANGKADVFDPIETGVAGELAGHAVPPYLKLRAEETEMLRAFLPALKKAGVRRCTFTYNGGTDEGFGEMTSCEDANGTQIEIDSILANDAFLKAVEPYLTAEQEKAKSGPFYRGQPDRTIADLARSYLDFDVATFACAALLGNGFGTGEYLLYGRAFLDLDTMTLTDDPKAPYPHGTSL